MITEAGDAHPTKFRAIRDVISKYVPVPADPIPPPSPKGRYGAINFTQIAPLLSSLHLFPNVSSASPLGMERLGYAFGYVLYSTSLSSFTSPQKLQIARLQDRGLVYLDGVLQGAVGWAEVNPFVELTLKPTSRPNPRLDILVENKARCSGEIVDFGCALKVRQNAHSANRLRVRFQGIWGEVRLGQQVLQGWANVQVRSPLL